MPAKVQSLYRSVQSAAGDIKAPAVGDLLSEVLYEVEAYLARRSKAKLKSKVGGKKYFAFAEGDKISRAVNSGLYQPSVQRDWAALLTALDKKGWATVNPDAITAVVYSFAIGFCSIIDLTKKGDQKTPGTFFEYLVGHLFARRLGVNPTTRLPVLNLDLESTLPTDFIFDLGPNKAKYHLPVKTSTRERVIQVWAHQRVLDGVYGTGRFLGTPVILTETKTDSVHREVVEICLPDQWRIYQMHIAQLRRVYYLDVPQAYALLNDVFPPLAVKPFGRFFLEANTLT